jgi:hypothetical protein
MKTKPACDRCGANPGDHVWVAASRPAEKVFGEFRLCPTCIERLRSFFSNGKNRPAATQKPPDRPVTGGPAAKSSRADEIPIRRSSWAQTQRSCHQGQSSEPEAMNLGHRGEMRPPVMPLRISPFGLALRNRPRFQVVARS